MSQKDLDFCQKLADLADEISMARFGALDLVIETKPDLTPVSDADKKVEEELRKLILEYSPTDSIIGEEFGVDGESNREWILDPIDGTKNFVRGGPFWGTLIGLRIDNKMQVGMVSAPALGRRWFGAIGHGSYLRTNTNNFKKERKLQVSKVSRIEDAYFGYSSQERWAKRNQEENFEKLLKKVWRARGFGDFIIHMMVAEGSIDFSMEPKLALWDMAALEIIVKEAGGKFSNLSGVAGIDGPGAISSNGVLHNEIVNRFN